MDPEVVVRDMAVTVYDIHTKLDALAGNTTTSSDLRAQVTEALGPLESRVTLMEGDHARIVQNNLQNDQLLVNEVALLKGTVLLLSRELNSMKKMMMVTPTPTQLP